MPAPRAAIWDVDGTLVDTAEIHFAAWQAFAAAHGFGSVLVEGWNEGWWSESGRNFKFATRQFSDDDALDADVAVVEVNRRHRLVRGLQTNAAVALAHRADRGLRPVTSRLAWARSGPALSWPAAAPVARIDQVMPRGAEGRPVRAPEALLVRLAAGRRVDLVPAQDQGLAAR